MLNSERLAEAVAIHQACYALLKWMVSAIDRGFVAGRTAHTYVSDADAASEWIEEHYLNLPVDCRPVARRGEPLRRFANYFSSYLTTSFELHEAGQSEGCSYDLCRYLDEATHLRPRKPAAADKKRAQRLKRDYLVQLALAVGSKDPEAAAARLVAARGVQRDISLAAYGFYLLRRCEGHSTTPAILALWREVSRRSGAPVRGFRLKADGILDAEGRLVGALAEGTPAREGGLTGT